MRSVIIYYVLSLSVIRIPPCPPSSCRSARIVYAKSLDNCSDISYFSSCSTWEYSIAAHVTLYLCILSANQNYPSAGCTTLKHNLVGPFHKTSLSLNRSWHRVCRSFLFTHYHGEERLMFAKFIVRTFCQRHGVWTVCTGVQSTCSWYFVIFSSLLRTSVDRQLAPSSRLHASTPPPRLSLLWSLMNLCLPSSPSLARCSQM